MNNGDTLQRWAAIATILALAVALVALLRDTLDIKLPPTFLPVGTASISGVEAAGAQPAATALARDTAAPARPTNTAAPTATPGSHRLSIIRGTASSKLAPEQTINGVVTYEPEKAYDDNLASAWVEGVAGPGIGEWLTLRFERPVTITRLGLDIGFDRDEAIFFQNHRVRRARVSFSNGDEQTLEFGDQRGVQYATMNHGPVEWITVTIEGVYTGAPYDDTPIAEVIAWGYETP